MCGSTTHADRFSKYYKVRGIMFTLGIILLISGCVLWMWTKLSTRYETKALGPMNVRVRNIELFLMQERKRKHWVDSRILMILGAIIVLVTALFN